MTYWIWSEEAFLASPATKQCETWSRSTLPELEDEPVISDIPSLLLAGQFDFVSPPYVAESIAANLSNSFYYEIPYGGHVTSFQGACPLSLAITFIEDPTVAPDASCLNELTLSFQ